MSAVHASRGPLKPAGPELRSEVDIVCRIAEATLGDRRGPSRGPSTAPTTPHIRHAISHVVPGCASYDEKVRQPGGFVLPHPPRDSREFPTDGGQGDLQRQPDGRPARARGAAAAADAAQPRPVQHHDLRAQRPLPRHLRRPPRGVRAPRRHRRPRASTTATWSTWSASGRTASSGRAPSFRIVEYDTPRGCAAAYYPEANPLVPLDSTARGSNCPTSKSIIVRLQRATGEATLSSDQGSQAEVGADRGHKSDVEPEHLS